MFARLVLVGALALALLVACGGGIDAETKRDGEDMADALMTLYFCSSLDTPRCDAAFETVVQVCVIGQGSDGKLKPFCERFEDMLPVSVGSNKLLVLSADITEYIGD